MTARILTILVGMGLCFCGEAHAGYAGGGSQKPFLVNPPDVSYAIIDLGKLPTTTGGSSIMPDGVEVDRVAMGMDGRVAFSWWDGNDYKVAKWKNGQFTDGSPKVTATEISFYNWTSQQFLDAVPITPGDPATLLSPDGSVLRYSPAVTDESYASWYNSDGTGFWTFGQTTSNDLWHGGDGVTTYGTDGWTAMQFLDAGDVIGLEANAVVGVGILSAADLDVSFTYDGSNYQDYRNHNYESVAISPGGELVATYANYDPPSQIESGAEVLMVDPDGTETDIRSASGSNSDTIVGQVCVVNDNKEFITRDSDLGKFVYFKGKDSQGKLGDLFPIQYFLILDDSSKMLGLTNGGKLLLNMDDLQNVGTDYQPNYQWTPRTFIADPRPPFLYKKNLSVAAFPEGWDVKFPDTAPPVQITEGNIIASTIVQTETTGSDGTYTAVPTAQQKKRPGICLPYQFAQVNPNSGFDGETKPHWLMIPQNQTNWTKAVTPASANFTIKFEVLPGSDGTTVTPTLTNQSPETLGVSSPILGDKSSVVVGVEGGFGTEGLKLSVKKYHPVTLAIHAVTQHYAPNHYIPLKPNDGIANVVCVRPNPDATILDSSTLGGDDHRDMITGVIDTGANGVCESTADPLRATQVIQVGWGLHKDIPPQYVPARDELESYLNNVFGLQSNTYFTVTRDDKSVDYDIQDGDQKLTISGLSSQHFTAEEKVLETLKDNSATFNVYYVAAINYPMEDVAGKAADDIAYIEDFTSTIQDVMTVTAHELGHCFGLMHSELPSGTGNTAYLPYSDPKKRLMYGRSLIDKLNPLPTLLIKAEWDKINQNTP